MNKILLILLTHCFSSAFSQEIDTLRVYQNDSLVFKKMDLPVVRPCSKPRIETSYKLIHPKNNTYYFIYNDKAQLIKEGVYTSKHIYQGVEYGGNFYNSKYYSYNRNGSYTIHYQEDGRNSKTEYYNRKNEILKTIYFDKKSQTPTKIEYYKKGKVKETEVFNT